jgi:hypothetical protein
MASQTSLNGIFATLGAAAGVGGFIVLLKPQAKKWAVAAAIFVLLVGFGAVAFFEGLLTQGEKPNEAV